MNLMLKIVIDYWYVFLALVTYYFIIMPYILASLRQNLFNLRADWFCFAADDNIGFDNIVYQKLREMINAFIRMQKYFTIVSFAIFVLFENKNKKVSPEIKLLNREIKKCNAKQKEEIHNFSLRFGKISIMTLMISSPILSVLIASAVLVLVAFTLLFYAVKKITGAKANHRKEKEAHRKVEKAYKKRFMANIVYNKNQNYQKAA